MKTSAANHASTSTVFYQINVVGTAKVSNKSVPGFILSGAIPIDPNDANIKGQIRGNTNQLKLMTPNSVYLSNIEITTFPKAEGPSSSNRRTTDLSVPSAHALAPDDSLSGRVHNGVIRFVAEITGQASVSQAAEMA